MRTALLVLGILGTAADASTDYQVGPRLIDPLGVTNDGLGFSIAGSATTAGGALVAAGTLGTYVAVARLAPGASSPIIEQRLQSGISNDNFGLSVALGGTDGQLLAVGAPADDSVGFNAGRVYFYRRPAPGAMYALAATLNPPNPSEAGNFGTSVALSADGSRLVVGEPKAQQAAVEIGAIHVYDLSGPTIGAAQTVFSEFGSGNRFGQAVAISGNRIAVGAPLAEDTGALRVLNVAGTNLSFDGGPLFADDRQSGDRLGLSIAIDGDTVIGGAGTDDKPSGGQAGSAYVFRRATNWQQEAKLRSTSPQPEERFGQAVALRAGEAAVGAYCLNVSGCVGPGAVYVFNRNGANWTGKQRLTAADAGSFGHAAAFAGNRGIAIGAFSSDGAFVDQGAIYLAALREAIFANGFEN